MNYADRLEAAVRDKQSACLVGLDPHLALLPDEFAVARDTSAPRAERAAAVEDFLCQVIEIVAPYTPIVKPQSAFFEVLGADGVRAWENVCAAAHGAGLLVLGDVKRGDIGSTASAYASAFLEGDAGTDPATLCDAVTVNPWLGSDSIQPFLDACKRTDKGLYVLVRTSNPSSGEFQDSSDPPMMDRVADAVSEWGGQLMGASGFSSVGAVVGATHPEELIRLRERMPTTPLLIPGYGAQGAGAAEVLPAFTSGLSGAIVNSSRGILFAKSDLPWRDATLAAIQQMQAAFGSGLVSRH